MKMMKNLTLIALGATLVVAYQKYNEPLMISLKRAVKKSADCTCDELEDMM
ncbi:MAG: hypothetical protein PHO63_03495 [Bacilli bacterium]|nr:hypothetical protein [Bacilli bacterium]MDD4809169.1 hypothetical protein [Bacilli bacterium]